MSNKIILLACVCLLAACATTTHLDEGETLYVGVEKMEMLNQPEGAVATQALDEVVAALSYPPNGAILQSNSLRSPLSFGLPIHNAFRKYADKKGLGHWIYKHLGSEPVYVSMVNPETRSQVATNLLHDYGYFGGRVGSRIVPQKDPRKAKIRYTIDWARPYFVDTIYYYRFPDEMDSLIQTVAAQAKLAKGTQFNVPALEEERTRISSLLRNNGYYYFTGNYLTYQADTLQRSGHAQLRLMPTANISPRVLRKYYMGRTRIFLRTPGGAEPTDSLRLRNTTFYYSGKRPPIRPHVLRKRLFLENGQPYSAARQDISQSLFTRLGTFQYTEFKFHRADTARLCDTLDLDIYATMDRRYDAELECNVTTKSTDQMGPGAVFTLQRNNFVRRGAKLIWETKGSYEWQTHSSVAGHSAVMNSYELGTSLSLEFPELYLPLRSRSLRRARFPQSTRVKLSVDQLNRASFFKMLSIGGELTYHIQPSRTARHTITPFSLVYNTLQHTTAHFDSITMANPSLAVSLGNQFIPSVSYTYSFDNSRLNPRHTLWWETTVKSAGNITSLLYAAAGKPLSESGKQLMGNPFAQFLKVTSECRATFKLWGKHQLATRLMGGVVWAYGNQRTVPYSEQFYIGGANSIRAFTVRSLGPGSFLPSADNRYGYMDETGDVKFEANAEYRFPILADLYGALFLDAGNVWTLRHTAQKPGSRLTLKTLADDIALGTGAGLRYDLSFLVLRVDLGVALHVPYETGKGGYYNIPRFKDGLGLHFAIGYPF